VIGPEQHLHRYDHVLADKQKNRWPIKSTRGNYPEQKKPIKVKTQDESK